MSKDSGSILIDPSVLQQLELIPVALHHCVDQVDLSRNLERSLKILAQLSKWNMNFHIFDR